MLPALDFQFLKILNIRWHATNEVEKKTIEDTIKLSETKIVVSSNLITINKSIKSNKEIINNKGFSHFRITKNIFTTPSPLSTENLLAFQPPINVPIPKQIPYGILTKSLNKNVKKAPIV